MSKFIVFNKGLINTDHVDFFVNEEASKEFRESKPDMFCIIAFFKQGTLTVEEFTSLDERIARQEELTKILVKDAI